MIDKRKCPHHSKQTGTKVKNQLDNTSNASQRQRLLEWLKEKPITTIEARHTLNILSPAARIYELRHDYGWNIQTVWIEAYTPERRRHKVAKYYLLPGKYAPEGQQPRES